MTTYAVGTQFSNGFTVTKTPTSPGNETGEYVIANSVGFQYFVTLMGLGSYDTVGNANTGASTSSNSGSTTVVYSSTASPPGSPFGQIPTNQISPYVVSPSPGSMVRLVNLSTTQQPTIVGYDNSSTTSGRVLFACQLDAGQSIDYEETTTYGITLQFLSAVNADNGINVANDYGVNASMTGYPFAVIPASSTAPVIVASQSAYVVRLINNSLTDQNAFITGYDSPSSVAGRVLFSEQLAAGQSVKIGLQANYGIYITIQNGPTNGDYPINVTYALAS